MSALTIKDFLSDYSRLVVSGTTDSVATLIAENYAHISEDCQLLLDEGYQARGEVSVAWEVHGEKAAMKALQDIRELPKYEDIIPEFKEFTTENYESGYDVFVECFSDLELRQWMKRSDVKSLEGALSAAKQFVEIREERKADCGW